MTASENHQVELINVDETPLKDIIKLAIGSKQIVITCFNLKLANILNLIRHKMSISSRVIFHLHNQATIALWPLKIFGMLDYLNSEDIFISSCTRDLKALHLSVKNVKSFVVPFALMKDDLLETIKMRTNSFNKKLYYVGRVSRQKNIHLIIEAIKLLRDENINIEFDIYGGEDNLGSPNMGIKDNSYQNELLALIKKNNLENLVHLHGHISRDELYKTKLIDRQIFITASSHSDENFGMALYRALLKGDQAVVSDWGAHSDFKENFEHQINYFKIYQKDRAGLGANISDIKNKIIETLNSTTDLESGSKLLENNSETNTAKLYSEIIQSPTGAPQPISFSMLFDKVIEAKEKFKDHPTKVFEDYNDPNAVEFLKAYGLVMV